MFSPKATQKQWDPCSCVLLEEEWQGLYSGANNSSITHTHISWEKPSHKIQALRGSHQCTIWFLQPSAYCYTLNLKPPPVRLGSSVEDTQPEICLMRCEWFHRNSVLYVPIPKAPELVNPQCRTAPAPHHHHSCPDHPWTRTWNIRYHVETGWGGRWQPKVLNSSMILCICMTYVLHGFGWVNLGNTFCRM